MNRDEAKCLLICSHLQASQAECNTLCAVDKSAEQKRNDQTGSGKTKCVGNGKEICYKMCRLKLGKNITTCENICCK